MNELLQNKRMYFETSAVNYMYNEVFLKNGFDPEKTGKVNERRNCQWLISDITLWEIFLTKDKKLRDSLFDFSKLLFHKQLIMSPEELIVKFIDNGCPILENGFEFYSNGVFAPEWYKSCTIPDYYFEPADYDSFRNYAANIRNIGKSSLKLGKLETNSKNNSNPFIVDLDGKKIEISGKKRHSEEVFNKAFMDNIYNKLISEYNNKTNENIQYVLVSMNVALTILCYGTGINRNIIDAFWNRIGVYNPYKRLLYTANNYLNVFFRGPLANISKMIMSQGMSKPSRGVHFDSLHSVYITYVDMFLTHDNHFIEYKNTNKDDFNMTKIVSINEMQFEPHNPFL